MNANHKTVLVVDDEQTLRFALAAKLQNAGFDVVMASNGDEGLRQALTHKPDMLLVDILMPVMDGFEMLEALRKDTWGKSANVIVLSNQGGNQQIAQAVIDGAYGYMIKSDCKMEDIINEVSERLAHNSL